MSDFKSYPATDRRECMAVMGSHVFLRGLNRSADAMHMVPSLPPTQYSIPPRIAAPQLLLRLIMGGTDIHFPTRGSSRSTVHW